MPGILAQTLDLLAGWRPLDTWIVVTAALAAMGCSLPGVFLVLRRQSMTGDALSHTSLPGIVIAFLLAQWLNKLGWISPETYETARHGVLFLGAMVVGVATAVLTEWVHKLGRVEASAALGVVFTTLFALGLILIRTAADNVDLDPDCVLYGTVETVVIDTLAGTGVPRAAVLNGLVLLVNLGLVVIFFKELRISAFDPALATTLGINATLMHYALMAVTAATLVAAFESVGSILVIAMLIVPAATASLLSRQLWLVIVLSLAVAGLSAPLGHVMAIVLPPLIFGRLGFDSVVDASTAGMMAVAVGMLFAAAVFLAPGTGILARIVHHAVLVVRIAAEDVLGVLYRAEEAGMASKATEVNHLLENALKAGPLLRGLAMRTLIREGKLVHDGAIYRLTPAGRDAARAVVRSHRLWEAYLAKHFQLAEDHFHDSAARAEHYIDSGTRERMAEELDQPGLDPHGRSIPKES
ncbi:MAG: metal ABC transporter permease [Pirellulales bacterium]|nr:metal ABC transporter permease [Pirellulales bacterium]